MRKYIVAEYKEEEIRAESMAGRIIHLVLVFLVCLCHNKTGRHMRFWSENEHEYKPTIVNLKKFQSISFKIFSWLYISQKLFPVFCIYELKIIVLAVLSIFLCRYAYLRVQSFSDVNFIKRKSSEHTVPTWNTQIKND